MIGVTLFHRKPGAAMTRFMQIVGLAVVALLLWHGGSAFAAESRIALVIGNGGYAEAPLANAGGAKFNLTPLTDTIREQ